MELKNTLYVFLASALFGCQGQEHVPVVTFQEAEDPTAISAEAEDLWNQAGKQLNGAWGSIDWRYSRSEVPRDLTGKPCELSAWRGEKASAQLLLWAAEGANGVTCHIGDFKAGDRSLPGTIAEARFVKYTLADVNSPDFKKGGPCVLMPDMLDSLSRFDMAPRTTRPVWITVQVPQDAVAGVYESAVTVESHDKGKLSFPLRLKVIDHLLPPPGQWNYHLDLWQHPSAVARAEGLEMWSDGHFEALRKEMVPLARAGQKVITATLNKDPWNHQCYDAYGDMIKWTRRKDGSWSYDYRVFDRWVEMMLSVGINRMINCYSMVPWNCELDYFDEAANEKVTVVATPGKPEFARMWGPFLTDFKKHLDEKGWLGITNIAMDERSPEQMDAAVKVLEKYAPEMGFAIADNHKSYKKYGLMRDVCVSQGQKADHDDIIARRAGGFNTTFYVCCSPFYPNTFTFSHPYEAELLGWYGLACDYDGMLRWAFNSWPENPQYDSRFGNWGSGDTYLAYPYSRSSIRFERLIDGIEAAEKVRILRREGVDLGELEGILEEIRGKDINDSRLPWQEVVEKADSLLNSL